MKKLIVLAFFALPALAFAKAAELVEFKKANPDKAATASCTTCHGATKKAADLTEDGKKWLEMKKK